VNSLFFRLSAAFALTAAAACLVIGAIVYQQTSSGLFMRARDKAAQEVASARDIEVGSDRLPLAAQYDTRNVPPQLVAQVQSAHLATFITGRGSRERVWAAAYDPRIGAGIYLSDSLNREERELATLRSTLVVAGLIATGVAALIGVALAAWLSSRLRRASGTARRIAAGDDEVASLAKAIDEMADALEERIRRERKFAADAAHELRTPLAGIVAASQLLPEGRPATMVREGIGQLRRLVDQLLELARLEGGLDTVTVDQVDLKTVARAAQLVYPGVIVDAPESSLVSTDLRRLERVVANLVENALRYGAPPVTIHVAGQTVAVSDHGPGFDADLIPRATERFSVGESARSQGAGLGLAITAEHVKLLGARLDVANRPGGGGLVTVELIDLQATEGMNGA
jgi:two-component system sensor histidine kinase MtrB